MDIDAPVRILAQFLCFNLIVLVGSQPLTNDIGLALATGVIPNFIVKMSESQNLNDSEALVTEDHNHVVIDIDQIPSTYFEDPNSLESGTTCSLDSYRPIHSLLLCPSQWSTFLEQSPVSLVRSTDIEGGELEGVQVVSTQAEVTPCGYESTCELTDDNE